MACCGAGGIGVCVEGVYKSYGGTPVLVNVGFRANKGEITVLVGPNGSGKTTLLRIILGLLRPDRGRVCIRGYDSTKLPPSIRRGIGYAPEKDVLPRRLRVAEYLEIIAESKNASDWSDLVEVLGLGRVLGKKIANLSQGYRKRVQVAAALIGEPEILVLDEPYSNIDIDTRMAIDSVLQEYREKTVTIMATHVEPTIQVDKLVILFSGRVVARLGSEELRPIYVLECNGSLRETRDNIEVERLIRKGCGLRECRPYTLVSILRRLYSERGGETS